MPLPHSQEDLPQMTLGPYRMPKCVKENVQFIYTVAFIVKTIVLSRSRTVFLKRVVEDKCLSSAAFPSRDFLDITLLVWKPSRLWHLAAADCFEVSVFHLWVLKNPWNSQMQRTWTILWHPHTTSDVPWEKKYLVPTCILAEVTSAIWEISELRKPDCAQRKTVQNPVMVSHFELHGEMF